LGTEGGPEGEEQREGGYQFRQQQVRDDNILRQIAKFGQKTLISIGDITGEC